MTVIYNLTRIGITRQNLYRVLIAKNIRKPSTASYYENQLIKLSPHEVIWLASLEPELFGHISEKKITKQKNLLPRLAENHDARTPDGRRVEIKCSRYQISNPGELNYCWTRINILPDAGYDLLLFALLTEWGFKIRVLDKQQVQNLAQKIGETRKLGNPRKLSFHRNDFLKY
jgi:hypothetical protein